MNEFSEHPSEKKTPPQIKSSRMLASALNFTPDNESSTGRLKVYTKPFKDDGGEGLVVTTFDTVYKPLGEEKPYQYERISFSVRLEDGSAWTKQFPRQIIKDMLSELEIKTNREGVVEKQLLKNSGYQQLYSFLSNELEEGGRIYTTSERLISEMIEEQTKGIQFIENRLIPEMQKRFPQFSNIMNEYKESKEIYFFREKEKDKKTAPVIRFLIKSNKIGDSLRLAVLIEAGRSKIEDDQVDEDYFHPYGKPHTIAPPYEMQDIDHPRASWTFDEFDQALEKLSGHLERKQAN